MPRRTKAAMSSTDAASLQCRSSSTRTSGCRSATSVRRLANRPMQPMALVAEPRGARRLPPQGRQHPRDVGQQLESVTRPAKSCEAT